MTPHELRNAWQTAKQLEDRLELADQPVLRRIARYLREQTFLALMQAEGYVEVPELLHSAYDPRDDQKQHSDRSE